MKINVFLQARVSSSRLPGKVMRLLLGEPMIMRQIERIKKSVWADEIILLTSLDSTDDYLSECCHEHNIKCFRGDLNDVLSRFTKALKEYPCDHVVRITGDCPLLDWDVLDFVIEAHLDSQADYTSNVISPTYPDGLDVEVMTADCLKDIALQASESYEREHVTYYCYQHPDRYKLHNVLNPIGDESDLRWTVDQIEDFQFVEGVYQELYKGEPFPTSEIRSLLVENPSFMKINKGISRNEGFKKSISMEAKNEIL